MSAVYCRVFTAEALNALQNQQLLPASGSLLTKVEFSSFLCPVLFIICRGESVINLSGEELLKTC